MPKPTDRQQARAERFAELRGQQDAILSLTPQEFSAWCTEVALLETDSVIGLVFRLTNMAQGFEPIAQLAELKRAEKAAVDQLDGFELRNRWEAKRLTGYQLEYWEFRRPKEIPRVDGLPAWVAAAVADVVDAGE